MKKHSFSSFAVTMLMAFLVSFTLSSCSEEILVEEKQETQQEENFDIPEGAVVFTTGGDEITRTSLDLNAYFYWTADNTIWVDTDKDGTFGTRSDNMEMSEDKRFARFFFTNFPDVEGDLNLTYTGTEPISATKVKIKADQSQIAPNDGTVVGKNGDCATAVATKNGKGQYIFTLQHKAHYLIFQPYKDIEIPDAKEWYLKKIEIISLNDENLSGTFNFAKNYDVFSKAGIEASGVEGGSNTVTINTGGAAGVKLIKWDKSVSDPDPNPNSAWYAVIAPTTATSGKHWLRIKYTVYPDAYINYNGNESTLVKSDIVIVKDVEINSAANKVTKIAHKMTAERIPTDEFYQWNAPKSYWYGVPLANRPTYYTAVNSTDYPKTTSDQRYTTLTSAAPASTSTPATNTPCSNLPDVNALTWYAMAGDARWDYEYPWRFDDDFDYIYTQGTWFLKWEHIVTNNVTLCPELATTTKADCPISFKRDNVTVYNNDGSVKAVRNYDGTDYRKTTIPQVTGDNPSKPLESTLFQPRYPWYKTNGRPKDVSRYFILPVNGHVTDGKLQSKGVLHGCYWSSTAVPGSANLSGIGIAYIMETKNFSLWVRQDNGSATDGRSALDDWWK